MIHLVTVEKEIFDDALLIVCPGVPFRNRFALFLAS